MQSSANVHEPRDHLLHLPTPAPKPLAVPPGGCVFSSSGGLVYISTNIIGASTILTIPIADHQLIIEYCVILIGHRRDIYI